MKISVAGTGYVEMSIATLMAQHNEVTCVDVVPGVSILLITKSILPIETDTQVG